MYMKDFPVWVSRLGPLHGDKKYRAEIAGIAHDLPECRVYILRMLDKLDEANPYDYIVITESCIDPRV